MLARVLKFGAVVAVAAAVGSLIYRYRLWDRDWSTIDDGWASLIGSTVGSFLAVVGALYVSKAEERRKKKAFEDFVRICVQNLVVQASYLEAMARESHKIGPTPEVQVSIISIQLRTLTDALAVFDREVAHSKDGDYQLRREIIGLDAMLGETRHALSMDAAPIQAIHNWHVGAYQVRYHASLILDALGWLVPIPSAKLVAECANETIATWKKWNVPIENTSPPVSSVSHTENQPLRHAHA